MTNLRTVNLLGVASRYTMQIFFILQTKGGESSGVRDQGGLKEV